jgi:hypothetical protein
MRAGSSKIIIIAVVILLLIVGILLATLALTPSETNPAYAAAQAFVDAAARGDDSAANGYLSDDLQAYVAANCPDGSVSACVAAYIPPEWGAYQSIVFRRATPDGAGWHVDLIGTWAEERGFSGVCVYANMQQDGDGAWKVQRWAGFAWCGDPATRNMATNTDAPNRVP